ncbi:hypothetical protein CRENPOLYSF2_1860012 [Crenothrix polyspora]|uniref:Uncharacterized protein n=1 Tax=Crenothrix polyspora TaxID=360316 RepID=A0A1R4H3H2_9GAMM|nr:hypothetical protein CRENPOLYSF2_1860012 [Crenothrix polyspora]
MLKASQSLCILNVCKTINCWINLPSIEDYNPTLHIIETQDFVSLHTDVLSMVTY